jgi:hypothetical protein
MNMHIDPPSSACRHLLPPAGEGSYTQAKVFFITILKIVPLKMKRFPLILDAILLPPAGEGADRRMRVDQTAQIPLTKTLRQRHNQQLLQFLIRLFQNRFQRRY